jgi:hypothetical protein
VINMTRALAAEWGPRNIRVNALAPGYFPSRMTKVIIGQHGDEFLRQTPLGKLGGDTDLMGAALLLASDADGHITGQTLVIDGGASIIRGTRQKVSRVTSAASCHFCPFDRPPASAPSASEWSARAPSRFLPLRAPPAR